MEPGLEANGARYALQSKNTHIDHTFHFWAGCLDAAAVAKQASQLSPGAGADINRHVTLYTIKTECLTPHRPITRQNA